MLRKIFAVIVILMLPAWAGEAPALLAQTAPMPARRTARGLLGSGRRRSETAAHRHPAQPASHPGARAGAPDLNGPSSQTAPFEHGASVLSLPGTFASQMSPTERVAPESIISQSFCARATTRCAGSR